MPTGREDWSKMPWPGISASRRRSYSLSRSLMSVAASPSTFMMMHAGQEYYIIKITAGMNYAESLKYKTKNIKATEKEKYDSHLTMRI
jgi:hypothetical protein